MNTDDVEEIVEVMEMVTSGALPQSPNMFRWRAS